MVASTEISKDTLGGQGVFCGVGILAVSLWQSNEYRHKGEAKATKETLERQRCQKHAALAKERGSQYAEPAQESGNVDYHQQQ
jgi:hypothetical protein